MTVQVLAWGCTSGSDFAVSVVGSVQPLAFSAENCPDFNLTRALSRGNTLAMGFDFTSDGGLPWPGVAIWSEDTVEPIVGEFSVGLSTLGSFIFPADLDGAPEAAIADGGQGPLMGMAYQDPSSVDIEGGTIRNVTFYDVSIDGGEF
jgi:hypothetical protein